MQSFLEFLVKEIVDSPDKVVVVQSQDNQGIITLTLSCDPQDIGKIIGKSGRIIKALRDLVRIVAVKQNLRVNVVLQEEQIRPAS